jgi:exodeoxyribonuclease V beta subunit
LPTSPLSLIPSPSPSSLIPSPLPFNVLDRALPIHQNYLLEASAGTGKTFSIQNIVVRLLIEKPSIPLNKILVVTFTRAATRDLLLRIRTNIEDCLSALNQWLDDATIIESAPDYLKGVMEEGEEAVADAKRSLQHALFTYDQASIFTIHSFCSRMLKQYAIESDMGFHANDGLDALPNSELRQVIRDFFRTELHENLYSPAQMAIILSQDPKQNKLLSAIKSNQEFAVQPTYQDLFKQFIEVMRELKIQFNNSILLLEDFEKQIVNYTSYKKIKIEERNGWIQWFVTLFDKNHWQSEDFDRLIDNGVLWHKFLDPSLLGKSKAALHSNLLHYPTFTQTVQDTLDPIVKKARDFSTLLVRLAKDCSQHLRRYQSEEERIAPDDLLTKMDAALNHPLFASKVRNDFQAAIIDEFQDTDPLQWRIFKKLFIPEKTSWEGFLYLVGDPKQSIYSFRHADIYTYLAAAQTLGEECCFTLNVNYRSQPFLIQALNTLFDSKHLPQFMPLPKKEYQLSYKPVLASSKNQPFHDVHGAVHFFAADAGLNPKSKLDDLEQKVFFPFIVQEIRRLRKEKSFTHSQFAVLVRDRHQALRLTEYFNTYQIPFINQKGISLVESGALTSLIDLLRAILHPHDRSAVKAALGSALIGFVFTELQILSSYDEIFLLIQQLRHVLIENGFSSFFEDFLQSQWKKDGITVQTRLLAQNHGLEFYHDLQQIADLIIEHQFNGWNTPEGLIAFLDHFEEWGEDENEKVMRVQDPNKDGVKIITMHYSKGLEFDVVFALGLIKRDSIKSCIIPIEKEGKIIQTPVQNDSQEFVEHCKEVDAEKMRQLYVALTRAKYQLYIPVILNQVTSLIDFGTASPIDLFLGRLQQPLGDYTELYHRIQKGHGKPLLNFLEYEGKQNHMTHSVHSSIELTNEHMEKNEVYHLVKPRTVSVFGDPLVISSFTGLSRHQAITKSENSLQLSMPPHDFEIENKHVHSLPASSTTGVFIHEIMEKIQFSHWKDKENGQCCIDLVRPYLSHSPFKNWEQTFADLIYNTLRVDLGILETPFCLADLQSIHHYREMPFLYPCKGALAIEELTQENGLIKGIIDLIFIYQNKYYIVDWKSNWLGPDTEAYELQNLHSAMEENSYFLQAEIYKEALRRYLKVVEARSFDTCFGGTFYLFMRGMKLGKKTGIYKV